MTEHTNLIDAVRLHNEQRVAVNQAYRLETQRLDILLAEQKEAQWKIAREGGHLVTVDLTSVARMVNLDAQDVGHDYSRNLPCWDTMSQWMILHCQGRNMLFEPVDNSDRDTDSAAYNNQTRTFAPKSTLKGSYRSVLTRHRTLNPGVLPIDIMKEVSHPVDAAMRQSNSISAWFELPEDAVLFKLTWS